MPRMLFRKQYVIIVIFLINALARGPYVIGDLLTNIGAICEVKASHNCNPVASYATASQVVSRGYQPAERRWGAYLAKNNAQVEALDHLNRAVQLKPQDFLAWFAIGEVFLLQGDLHNAINAFSLANAGPYFLYRASSIKDLSKDEILTSARFAVKLLPTNSESYLALGNALWSMDKRDEAIIEYRKAVALQPTDSQPYFQLGFALWQTGNASDQAISYLKKAVDIEPSYLSSYMIIGHIYRSRQEWDEAIFWYKRLEPLLPQDPEPAVMIGAVNFERGEYNLALGGLLAVTRGYPNYAQGYFYLGMTYCGMGEPEEAIRSFAFATDLEPNNSGYHLAMAKAYHALGNLRDAEVHYELALKLNPNLAEGKQGLEAVVQGVNPFGNWCVRK